MKRRVFPLLCATFFCISSFSSAYAWNLKDKIEEMESESYSEEENSLRR